MKANESWVGKKVKVAITDVNRSFYYPKLGTIGTVVEYHKDYEEDPECIKVQWPKGSTSGNDLWWINEDWVNIIDCNSFMSYSEIWKMLRPKMEKNGLHHYVYGVCDNELDDYRREELYKPEDFHKAVALAYKMGYERAMKGRPFKYSKEKSEKTKGHWEKVDPNNLPKDGSRVKLSRNSKDDHLKWSGMKIGDTGRVKKGIGFGVDLDCVRDNKYSWIAFGGGSADALDVWVEGDDAD